MKKVLITGSRGLLGSACTRLLSKDCIVLTPPDDLMAAQKVYWMFDRLRPDYVIHCAAKVGGVKANRDQPVDFIEQNVTINGNVIAACHLFDVQKLVNIGTSCMFPRNAPTPVKESSFMTGPLEPSVEAYATAKILAYQLCNAYRRQYGRKFVTVCPSNIYGPNDNYGPSGHVIPALVRSAFEAKKSGECMKVWGDGSAIREFIHSDDAAAAIKLVMESYDAPELISIGSGRGIPIRTLATMIASIVGVDNIEYDLSQPVGIQEKTFDTSKLKSMGFTASIELHDGLVGVCEDFKNNINIRCH